MKPLKVKILPDGTAKEVNQSTNRKMGKRHIAFESMLRTFEIENAKQTTEAIYGKHDQYNAGTIHDAEILESGKIRIL